MHYKRSWFLFMLLLPAGISMAQVGDSLVLTCPLANGSIRIIRSSDKNYKETSEYGVMISSRFDSTVQACHEGKVVIVKATEDKKYDLVISFKGYYFWYAGITTPKIKEGTKVKPGDLIGSYIPGDLLELLMFNAEEPENPRKYLKCK